MCCSVAAIPSLLTTLSLVVLGRYNGCDKLARDAVRDVHARASYELLPDVQLVRRHSVSLIAPNP